MRFTHKDWHIPPAAQHIHASFSPTPARLKIRSNPGRTSSWDFHRARVPLPIDSLPAAKRMPDEPDIGKTTLGKHRLTVLAVLGTVVDCMGHDDASGSGHEEECSTTPDRCNKQASVQRLVPCSTRNYP